MPEHQCFLMHELSPRNGLRLKSLSYFNRAASARRSAFPFAVMGKASTKWIFRGTM
jgi:hypothetical protein